MHRRAFLRLSAGALFGSAISILDPFVPSANAFPLLAAVQIAQVALNVAGLFAGGAGPDIASLLSQQVEMLRAMSAKLNAIQEEMLLILQRLDEVKQLIGAVPQQVVEEFQKQHVSGLLTIFGQRMDTYAVERDKYGIVFAQDNNVQPLKKQVLDPLRDSIAVLTGFYAPAVVPITCAASFVECEAMIVANYRKAEMKPIIADYIRWMTAMQQLLTTEIDHTQADYDQMTKKALIDENFDCWTRNTIKDGTARGTFALVQYRRMHARNDADPPEDAALNRSANEMIAAGIMPAAQRPTIRSLAIAGGDEYQVRAINKVPSTLHKIDNNKLVSLQLSPSQDAKWLDAMPSCLDENKKREAAFNNLGAEIYTASLRLMSLRALKFSTETTTKFLTERQVAIENSQEVA